MTRERLSTLCDQAARLALTGLLLVVPLVFYTQTHDVFETNKLAAFRLFTLAAALAVLTRALLVRDLRWRPSALAWPLVLIGVSSLLSTLFTNNWRVSVFGVYEDYEGILMIANYLLLWGIVHLVVRDLTDVRQYLTAVVVAGALVAAYGVAQNFGFDFVMWNPTTYSASRLFGSLGNPNFLAAYVLMALPVTLVAFWLARRPAVKVLLLVIVLGMVVCIFFTKSRGAAYALAAEAVTLGVYLFLDARRPESLWRGNRRWLLALGLLAALSLGLPNVRTAISTTVTRTLQTLDLGQIHITPRLYIWRSALQMVRDHPLLGVGLDTFQITFPKYRLPEYWQLEWNGTPEKAHNFFLQIASTTGLLGLGAWLWLLAAFFVLWLGQLRDLPPPRRHLALGVGVAQIGFLVQNQFSFTVVAYGSLFWFFLALGPTLSRPDPEPTPAAAAGSPFTLARVPLGSWLAFLGLAGVIVLSLIFSLRQWTADVFFKRGIINLTLGAPGQAVPFLEQSAALDPHREIYWVKYGIAVEEAAKRIPDRLPLFQRAVEIHRHTIAMNPLNGYNFNNLGRVYKAWGDTLDPAKLADAEQACRRAAELDPYNVYFALDLASVLLSQRRWAEAEAVARRVVELFPDFAMSYSYLGYVALVRDEVAQAEQLLAQAVEKNWRGDRTTQASTWSNLGIVRARRGDLTGAVAALRRALDLSPQYLDARMNLAVVLERLGRDAEALTEYRRLLADAPQAPGAGEIRNKIAILEKGSGGR